MKKGFTILLLLLSLAEVYAQTEFTTSLLDSRRNRIVPVAVYRPKKESPGPESLYSTMDMTETRTINRTRVIHI